MILSASSQTVAADGSDGTVLVLCMMALFAHFTNTLWLGPFHLYLCRVCQYTLK